MSRPREQHVSPAAVPKARHGLVDVVPAAGGLPELGRVDDRHVQLLASDPVHLLAQDLVDLAQRPPGEGEIREDAGCQLSDVPGA
jgi:hypothetical protein